MIRGTTPTLTFTIKSDTLDLSEAENLYATLTQQRFEITKTGEDIEVTLPRTVSIWLTQEESLKLVENSKAEVQLNWTYLDANGNTRRAATKPKDIQITKQLLKRVIE